MQRLPDPDEIDWLLDSMADLARRAGPDPLLRAPLVEPTREFFPDPGGNGRFALDRVTRRLLGYAGLGRFSVRFETFEGESDACALFCGIEGNGCRFAVNPSIPADPDFLAGVLAHEVAHAFRASRRLVRDDHDEEELLTDLTAVHLGFGILSTRARHSFRTGGELRGSMAVTAWRTLAAGYLSQQAFSFALATQVAARGPRKEEIRHVRSALEPNALAMFDEAARFLRNEVGGGIEVRRRLGIGDLIPEPKADDPLLQPLPAFDGSAWAEVHEGERLDRTLHVDGASGRSIFRVAGDRGPLPAMLGASAGLFAGFALTLPYDRPIGFAFLAMFAGAFLVHFGVGKGPDRCSETGCGILLEPEALTCPGCGGIFRGRLRSIAELYAEREKLGIDDAGFDWSGGGENEEPIATGEKAASDRTPNV